MQGSPPAPQGATGHVVVPDELKVDTKTFKLLTSQRDELYWQVQSGSKTLVLTFLCLALTQAAIEFVKKMHTLAQGCKKLSAIIGIVPSSKFASVAIDTDGFRLVPLLGKSTSGDLSRLSSANKLKVAQQVAEAMAFLHDNGVIHRMVCASAVMVRQQDLEARLIWTRFARMAGIDFEVSDSERPAQLFDAPEVIRDKLYLQPSDVYSFGVFCVELWVERSPFWDVQNLSVQQLLYEIVRGLRPKRPQGMSDQMWNLVQWCWKENSEERPSARDVLNTLSGMHWQSDLPTINEGKRDDEEGSSDLQDEDERSSDDDRESQPKAQGKSYEWSKSLDTGTSFHEAVVEADVKTLADVEERLLAMELNVYSIGEGVRLLREVPFSYGSGRLHTAELGDGKIALVKMLNFGRLGKLPEPTDPLEPSEVTWTPASAVLNEISMHRLIAHPNVPALLGWGRSQNKLCLVFDGVRNDQISLLELVHGPDKKWRSWKSIVRVLVDVADALVTMHSNRILHRNLRAANVGVRRDESAALLNFSCAVLVQNDGEFRVIQRPLVGAQEWMAPETLLRGEYSPRTDVFSFAVLIWEALALRKPHEYDIKHVATQDPKARLRFLARHRLERLSVFTEPLWSLCDNCWDPDPSKRPDMSQVKARLVAMLGISDRGRALAEKVVNELRSDLELRNALPELSVKDIKLLSRVSEGHYGFLFKGFLSGGEVAIKVIKLDVMAKEHANAHVPLLREFKCVLALRHPKLVRFHGWAFNIESLELMLVLQWMKHGSLNDFLYQKRDTRTPAGTLRLLRILIDVAVALQFMHERGYLHRDIACRNILVDDNMGGALSDFGLAIKESEVPRNERVGNVRWMAPETLKMYVYSKKTDVYSFGMTMWEAFAGQAPFSGSTALNDLDHSAIANMVQNGSRPQKPFTEMSYDVWSLITKCWSQRPEDRPDMAQVVTALQNLVAALEREPSKQAAASAAATAVGYKDMSSKSRLRFFPRPPSTLLERDSLVKAVREWLSKEERRVLQVAGPLGVGKSVTMAWVMRELAAIFEAPIVWLNCASEESLARDLLSLTTSEQWTLNNTLPKLPANKSSALDRQNAVIRLLRDTRGLLVLEGPAKFPGALAASGPLESINTIVLARDRACIDASLKQQVVELEPPEEADAVKMLSLMTGKVVGDSEGAGKLVKELGRLPLGLSYAASYVLRETAKDARSAKEAVDAFLQCFGDRRLEELGFSGPASSGLGGSSMDLKSDESMFMARVPAFDQPLPWAHVLDTLMRDARSESVDATYQLLVCAHCATSSVLNATASLANALLLKRHRKTASQESSADVPSEAARKFLVARSVLKDVDGRAVQLNPFHRALVQWRVAKDATLLRDVLDSLVEALLEEIQRDEIALEQLLPHLEFVYETCRRLQHRSPRWWMVLARLGQGQLSEEGRKAVEYLEEAFRLVEQDSSIDDKKGTVEFVAKLLISAYDAVKDFRAKYALATKCGIPVSDPNVRNMLSRLRSLALRQLGTSVTFPRLFSRVLSWAGAFSRMSAVLPAEISPSEATSDFVRVCDEVARKLPDIASAKSGAFRKAWREADALEDDFFSAFERLGNDKTALFPAPLVPPEHEELKRFWRLHFVWPGSSKGERADRVARALATYILSTYPYVRATFELLRVVVLAVIGAGRTVTFTELVRCVAPLGPLDRFYEQARALCVPRIKIISQGLREAIKADEMGEADELDVDSIVAREAASTDLIAPAPWFGRLDRAGAFHSLEERVKLFEDAGPEAVNLLAFRYPRVLLMPDEAAAAALEMDVWDEKDEVPVAASTRQRAAMQLCFLSQSRNFEQHTISFRASERRFVVDETRGEAASYSQLVELLYRSLLRFGFDHEAKVVQKARRAWERVDSLIDRAFPPGRARMRALDAVAPFWTAEIPAPELQRDAITDLSKVAEECRKRHEAAVEQAYRSGEAQAMHDTLSALLREVDPEAFVALEDRWLEDPASLIELTHRPRSPPGPSPPAAAVASIATASSDPAAGAERSHEHSLQRRVALAENIKVVEKELGTLTACRVLVALSERVAWQIKNMKEAVEVADRASPKQRQIAAEVSVVARSESGMTEELLDVCRKQMEELMGRLLDTTDSKSAEVASSATETAAGSAEATRDPVTAARLWMMCVCACINRLNRLLLNVALSCFTKASEQCKAAVREMLRGSSDSAQTICYASPLHTLAMVQDGVLGMGPQLTFTCATEAVRSLCAIIPEIADSALQFIRSPVSSALATPALLAAAQGHIVALAALHEGLTSSVRKKHMTLFDVQGRGVPHYLLGAALKRERRRGTRSVPHVADREWDSMVWDKLLDAFKELELLNEPDLDGSVPLAHLLRACAPVAGLSEAVSDEEVLVVRLLARGARASSLRTADDSGQLMASLRHVIARCVYQEPLVSGREPRSLRFSVFRDAVQYRDAELLRAILPFDSPPLFLPFIADPFEQDQKQPTIITPKEARSAMLPILPSARFTWPTPYNLVRRKAVREAARIKWPREVESRVLGSLMPEQFFKDLIVAEWTWEVLADHFASTNPELAKLIKIHRLSGQWACISEHAFPYELAELGVKSPSERAELINSLLRSLFRA